MKKITDKQRLDWLTKSKVGLPYFALNPKYGRRWNGTYQILIDEETLDTVEGKTPRQAIDAAMKAEAKHEEK